MLEKVPLTAVWANIYFHNRKTFRVNKLRPIYWQFTYTIVKQKYTMRQVPSGAPLLKWFNFDPAAWKFLTQKLLFSQFCAISSPSSVIIIQTVNPPPPPPTLFFFFIAVLENILSLKLNLYRRKYKSALIKFVPFQWEMHTVYQRWSKSPFNKRRHKNAVKNVRYANTDVQNDVLLIQSPFV